MSLPQATMPLTNGPQTPIWLRLRRAVLAIVTRVKNFGEAGGIE
jgi:hypothetical protein